MSLSSLHRTKKRRGRYRSGYRVEWIAAWAVIAAGMTASDGDGPQHSTFAAATNAMEPNMAPSPRLRRKVIESNNDTGDSQTNAKGDKEARKESIKRTEQKRRTKRKLFRLDEYMDTEESSNSKEITYSNNEDKVRQEVGGSELPQDGDEAEFWDRMLMVEEDIFSMSMSFATAVKN